MTVPPIPRHELVAAGETLVRRLSGRWQDSGGMCLCPAHADRSPSLSVRIGHSRLLFHCFAGCTGIEIIAAIRRMQPDALAEAHPMTSPPSAREVWLRARALDLWDESRDLEGSLAELYLRARSIGVLPDALRYHARAPLGRGRAITRRPALIAKVSDDEGFVAVQRTFLIPGQPRHARDIGNPRRMLGRPGRGAVRLIEPDTMLGLAEGIETALSAIILLDIPVWAVLGNERFAQVAIPDRVTRLVLLPDNDRAGLRGASLAQDAHRTSLRAVETLLPWRGLNDWNDVLRSEGRGGGGPDAACGLMVRPPRFGDKL